MTAPALVAADYGTGLDWRVHAACRGADPERFHPDLCGRRDLRPAAETAWAFCQPCPVLHYCDDLANRTDSTGIYGGALRRRDTSTGLIDRIPLVPAAPKREAS